MQTANPWSRKYGNTRPLTEADLDERQALLRPLSEAVPVAKPEGRFQGKPAPTIKVLQHRTPYQPETCAEDHIRTVLHLRTPYQPETCLEGTEASNDQPPTTTPPAAANPAPTAASVRAKLKTTQRLGDRARQLQQENATAAFERGLASSRRTGLTGGFAFGLCTGAMLSFVVYVLITGLSAS